MDIHFHSKSSIEIACMSEIGPLNHQGSSVKGHPPIDRRRAVFLTFAFLGLSSLLPWNFFITAKDYFDFKFRNTSLPSNASSYSRDEGAGLTYMQVNFLSYFSIVSKVTAVFFMFLTLMLVRHITVKTRVVASTLLIIAIFAATAALVKVDTDSWQEDFFVITLLMATIISGGQAVFRGSVLGLSAVFPPVFTQSAMIGMAAGGTFSAVASIVTLAIGGNPTESALFFFSTASVVTVFALSAFMCLYLLRFSRFYMMNETEQTDHSVIEGKLAKSVIEDDLYKSMNGENLTKSSNEENLSNYVNEEHLSNSVDGKNVTNSMHEEHVSKSVNEENLSKSANDENVSKSVNDDNLCHQHIKGKKYFTTIFKKTWIYCLSLVIILTVTLTVFPSLCSLIKPVNTANNAWTDTYFTPVVCFLGFNLAEFFGRYLTLLVKYPGPEKPGAILFLCILRLAFIPLLMLCNAQPRHHLPVVFDADVWPILFIPLLGLTNGYLVTLCMCFGPLCVSDTMAEGAGMMLVLSMNVGLAVGSVTSILCVFLL